LDNPSETYAYYDLPIPCKPTELVTPPESLGEVLEGDSFVLSPYLVKFQGLVPVPHAMQCFVGACVLIFALHLAEPLNAQSLCGEQTLNKEQIDRLRDAVSRFFTFSMVIGKNSCVGFVALSNPIRSRR
jgi:hypothetical protein